MATIFINLFNLFKSQIVDLLIVKVKLDNYGYNVLLALQGVSFTEVQEGLIVRREVNALRRLVALRKSLSTLLGFCPILAVNYDLHIP